MTDKNTSSQQINSSRFLVNEPPLLVLPSLAQKVGLQKAIILQQFQYWLYKSEHIQEDKNGIKRKWVYNTYEDWQEQFPFWTTRTVQNHILELEKDNIIISANFNKRPGDRTKWYTINYKQLDTVKSDSP